MAEKKAVVLLSGGLDSSTTLAMARHVGFACYALTFSYGQRHRRETESARAVAGAWGVSEHRIVHIDLAAFGGSALTDASIEVPKDGAAIEGAAIPATYVPARNTIFLSYALAWAEVLGLFDIFVGVNATDYSGYPDCRPEFVAAYEAMANLATAAAVEGKGRYRIHAPIIEMTKAQIIQTGTELGVDYGLTHSCYDPDAEGRSCGRLRFLSSSTQGFCRGRSGRSGILCARG